MWMVGKCAKTRDQINLNDDKEDRRGQGCGLQWHGGEVLCHQLDRMEAEKDHGDVSQTLGYRDGLKTNYNNVIRFVRTTNVRRTHRAEVKPESKTGSRDSAGTSGKESIDQDRIQAVHGRGWTEKGDGYREDNNARDECCSRTGGEES